MNAHRSRWFVLFALVAACATSDDPGSPGDNLCIFCFVRKYQRQPMGSDYDPD